MIFKAMLVAGTAIFVSLGPVMASSESATRDLGSSPAPWSAPERTARPIQSGLATWYGPGFHGRKTASGERFNANAMTAAHRTLPFGTRVKVVDQRTGREVVVRINDRGPFRRGTVIDLSRASAAALGVSGTAPVRLVSLRD